MLPDNFRQTIQVGKKTLLLPISPGVLLHEREYVGENNIRSSCEHEGLF